MTTAPGRRGLRPTKVVAIALPLLALLEIFVIIAVGRAIGPLWTIALMVATSLLGFWLMRREGSRAWKALQQAVRSGRMPARELADGMIVLVGGTLLTGPGFITDVVGLLLVLPFTRPVARNLLAAVITRRMVAQSQLFTGRRVGGPGPTGGPGAAPETGPFPGAGTHTGGARSGSSEEIIEGEIIDEDPPR